MLSSAPHAGTVNLPYNTGSTDTSRHPSSRRWKRRQRLAREQTSASTAARSEQQLEAGRAF